MKKDVYLIEEVKQLLEDVFNPDWSVKLCGRLKCKQLIHALGALYSGVDFGDSVTGMMNVEVIREYVDKENINPFKEEM